MPGHKGRRDIFSGVSGGAYGCDITELSFSDNLESPSGVIKKAEEDIAKLTGAKASYILTGGSTLGILAMLYAVKDLGKKVVIARGSHKSVYDALGLFGLEPVFLYEKTTDGMLCPDYVNKDIIENLDDDVIGVLLTSPDYFGNTADLGYFKENLSRQNKLLLIDGAHGSHFMFLNKEKYAGKYADIWVDGAHKTLETLTQGAVLNVSDERLTEKVEEGLGIFSTSSPSYLIMASVEDGIKSFAEIKALTIKKFEKNREKIVKAVKEKGFLARETNDMLKLAVDFNGKTDGNKVIRYFELQGIYPELFSQRFMLFMFSPYLSDDETARITEAVKNCPVAGGRYKKSPGIIFPERALSYLDAIKLPSEDVDLKESKGRIAAKNAGLFPPCRPVITAGEVFDGTIISALSAKNTFGLKNGRVSVIKDTKE